MLEQAVQEAARQAPNLTPIYALLGPLALKAIADIGIQVIKSRQERNKAKAAESQAAFEQARTHGIELVKDRNGHDKPAIVAFCPSHIGLVTSIATQEVELKHINEKLGKIEIHVEAIRGAVGK